MKLRHIFYPLRIIKKAKSARRMSELLVLTSFLITFAGIRTITHLQRDGILPNQDGPTHIHHLVPGIIFLLISGYIGLSFWSHQKVRTYMSILFGIGAALTIDEFALWLYLKDVYWEEQGRDSIDAIIITGVIFTIMFVLNEIHERYAIRRQKREEEMRLHQLHH